MTARNKSKLQLCVVVSAAQDERIRRYAFARSLKDPEARRIGVSDVIREWIDRHAPEMEAAIRAAGVAPPAQVEPAE